MRTLGTEVVTELESKEFRIFYLLEMNIDGTYYRYTNCDVAIAVQGKVYDSRPFATERISYSANQVVDNMVLTIDNLDNLLTTLFVGGTPRNSVVKLEAIILDENYKAVGSDVVDSELTTYWEIDPIITGLMPIVAIDTDLGLWEYDAATGGIMPISGSALDENWESDEVTEGIMPA